MKKQLITLTCALGALFFFQASTPAKKIKLSKLIKSNFSYVPSSEVTFEGKTSTVNAFYMNNFEVSNLDYREFIYHLKQTGKEDLLKKCAVDTNRWNTEFSLAFFEPMATQYHKHPAYDNYPVVGISQEAAEEYCKWLTNIYNDLNEDSNKTYLVRLPSHLEWYSAATSTLEHNKYAWGGPYLRNSKGCYLANFKTIGSENITYNEKKQQHEVVANDISYSLDNAMITAPVSSYFPSALGIYNLNGNIAEMVNEGFACGGSWFSTGYDIRNASYYPFEGTSTKVGFRPVLVVIEKS